MVGRNVILPAEIGLCFGQIKLFQAIKLFLSVDISKILYFESRKYYSFAPIMRILQNLIMILFF